MAVAELIDQIDKLTVLELSELVKTLEEKYGVSAAAPVAIAAAPGAAAAAGPAAEQTEFDVILSDIGAEAIQKVHQGRPAKSTSLGLTQKQNRSSRAPPRRSRPALPKAKPNRSRRKSKKPAPRSASSGDSVILTLRQAQGERAKARITLIRSAGCFFADLSTQGVQAGSPMLSVESHGTTVVRGALSPRT